MSKANFRVALFGAVMILPLVLLVQAGESHEAFNLIKYLGKFHPAVVHYPIAFLLGAALAELGNILFRREVFASAARFLVIIAALAAPFTVSFGWAAEYGINQFPAELQPVVETHETLALISTGLAIAAAVASELGRRRRDPRFILAFRIALFAAAAVVTVTGFFGGVLVYGIGHYRP